jgi:hypothetical protein
VTVLYALGSLMLHFVLGEPAPARAVLIDGLLPAVALNLLLTAPVYAIVRRVVRPVSWTNRTAEVRLLG